MFNHFRIEGISVNAVLQAEKYVVNFQLIVFLLMLLHIESSLLLLYALAKKNSQSLSNWRYFG